MPRVFAISDLHLFASLGAAVPNPMLRLGSHWQAHPEKLEQRWRATVGSDDVVAIPGDLSEASCASEAGPDLQWLHRLPGTKVIGRGNHDLWWPGDALPASLPGSVRAVDAHPLRLDDLCLCACMGWPEPDTHEGRKLIAEAGAQAFERERGRQLELLRAALAACAALSGCTRLVLLHYAPFIDTEVAMGNDLALTAFGDALVEARVEHCLYGHLHLQQEPGSQERFLHARWRRAPEGRLGATRFTLVSSDHLDFTPRLVHPCPGDRQAPCS